MTDNFLHAYFLNNAGKRLHKWMHYFDIYDQHFARFRETAPTVFEIGVAGGGSLPMWKAYFGGESTIVGLDITHSCAEHADEARGIHVHIGSQDDPSVLEQMLAQHGVPDIVIDDGSHVMAHMIATFEHLYHRTSRTGVYLVEDTHSCYWPKYGGGVGAHGSFMEFTKAKLDELHAHYIDGGKVTVSDFTRSTRSISIYDSIIAFERRPQGKRQAPITGEL